MLAWLKNLFNNQLPEENVKSFEAETAHLQATEYRKSGVASIKLDKIVGSVGRAHELDKGFRYRNRSVTGRYQNVSQRVQQGQPMEPIKVIRIRRDRTTSEFYVVDGHHRVAEAKARGFQEINAYITDMIADDAEKT